MEILQLYPQDQSLHAPHQVTYWVDAEVSQLKALMEARVVAELVSPSLCWDHFPQAMVYQG